MTDYTPPVRGPFCPVNPTTTGHTPKNETNNTTFTIVGLCMGAVTAWIVAYVHMWVCNWTGYYVISITFWFIIPLGGLLVGFLGALGVSFSNLSRSEDVPLSSGVVGMVIGLLSWYLAYRVLAWHDDYSGIFDYIGDIIRFSDITVAVEYHHHHQHGELGALPFLSMVSAIVEPVGAIVGGFVAGMLGAGNMPETSTSRRG
jgi:hypothetical protein